LPLSRRRLLPPARHRRSRLALPHHHHPQNGQNAFCTRPPLEKTILTLIAKGLVFQVMVYSLKLGKTYRQINLKPNGFPKSPRVQLAQQYANNSQIKKAIIIHAKTITMIYKVLALQL